MNLLTIDIICPVINSFNGIFSRSERVTHGKLAVSEFSSAKNYITVQLSSYTLTGAWPLDSVGDFHLSNP